MASTVNTKIIISAFMDNSFGEAMKSLNQFSSIPLAIGRNLMPVTAALTKFGKESLETYASFDDAMRTVEGKLGDVGARQMDALRTQAREWASTTRYHATDVAAALAEAAGSGWSLEEMYQGMPSVLAMAAGGNMDLSAALGYLSTALAGMNLGFDESAQVVDEWMKTASSSRATATDIGESLQMLGSIATFADSKEEMFTLLAMMAEFGTTGSEAGTLLRNVMMRVVAPTKSAAEAMAALGVTEEELSESLTEDGYDIGQAAQAMQSLGFSAYDTEGNLKPVTQIVSELRDATADMTEQQRFDVLSKIFPQRSIRGILDLMRATDEQYAQMMAEISGSAGYAQYMADLQEGGVGGSMRRLESQWEELQIAVGEQLAPIAMGAMQTIGNVLDGISGMDKGNLNILTRSLMGLAGAAPAMMAVGGAMRMISMLGTPGGQLTAAVVLASLAAGAIGGLIDNMEQLDRQRFEANFGTATIDTSMLSAALQQIQSEYAAASAEVAGYVSAVQQAAADYGTATSSLTGGLWTAMAAGLKLTPAQKLELEGYGDQMYQSLMEGARKSVDADLAFLELLSGGETPEELLGEAGPAGTMGSLLLSAYDGLTAAVQEKSDALKAAMKSAFSDDIITQEEYQNIMNAVSEMQEMSQLIFESQASAEYDNVIRKADRVGVEGVEQFVTQTAQVRDTQLAALENDLDRQYTSIMEKFRFAQAQGLEFMDPTTGQMVNASTLDEGWVSGFNRWYNEQAQGRRQGIMNDFNEAVLRGAESAALNSDFGGDWGQLMQMVGGEGFTSVGAMMAFGNAGEGTGSLQHMVTYAQEMVDAMGGAQAVMEAAAAMEASGNTEGAATMRGYASIAGIDTSFETQNEAQALYEAQQEKQRQQAEIDAAEELSSSEGGSVFDAVADAVSETSAALAKMLPTEPAPAAENTPAPQALPGPSETPAPGRWEEEQAAAAMAEAQAIMDATAGGGQDLGPTLLETIGAALTPSAGAEEAGAGAGHVAEWGEAWENMALEEATPMDPALMQLSAREMREVMAEDYQATVRLNAEAGTGGGEIGGQMAQQAQQAADSQPVEVPVEEPEVPEPDPVTVPVEPEEPDMALFEQFIKQMQPPPFMIQFAIPSGQADGSKYTTEFNGALTPGYQDVNTSDGGSAGSSWASAFQGALDANPGKFTVNVTASGNTKLLEKAESATSQTFANGGRADRASIFGEAGAEWAIPEEHSANTASLLMRAAAASGFTWPELITAAANRTGGGSSGGGDSLTYSPTFIINTDKAEDIEDILRRDKENMRRWWRETKLMEYRMAY